MLRYLRALNSFGDSGLPSAAGRASCALTETTNATAAAAAKKFRVYDMRGSLSFSQFGLDAMNLLSMIVFLSCAIGFASAGQPAPAAVITSEFVYESARFPSAHASTIAYAGGGLVAAWFGGTRERAPDVGI